MTNEASRLAAAKWRLTLDDCNNTGDFRELARRRLPGPVFHYIDGAADDRQAGRTGQEMSRSWIGRPSSVRRGAASGRSGPRQQRPQHEADASGARDVAVGILTKPIRVGSYLRALAPLHQQEVFYLPPMS